MEAARWQRAQQLFHDALARPAGERDAFLVAECADDVALADEVRALIGADARADSLLDRPLPEVAHGVFDASAPGYESIGPYRVVRLLEQGGMGTVYLAEHLGRRVAVKVLRDASLSPARRESFEREQRTLAQLTHPSIARLYEADVLADGTPYFVMEYVEGEPLTRFCRRERPDLAGSLRLFREVCEAVQYAHRQAVIHRDLKPANVLVTPEGTVKLLDFGIAAPIASLDLVSDSRRHQRLMTPAYAAPEQLRGDVIGVYTDIYALGLMLFELLFDSLPAEAGERPWARLAVAVSAAERADLDALFAKAMHAEPQDRYSSVEALIRDLDHLRDVEPLDSRAGTFAYRAEKFLRRNRTAVAASLLVVATILALATFYTVRLAEQRTLAQAEAAKAREISEYLINLFDAGDPFAQGENPDVRKLLERGVERVEGLAAQPAVQAQMLNALGRVNIMLSDYGQAEALLNRAYAARAKIDDPLELAQTLANLGLLHRYTSRFESAEKFTRDALAIRERHLPRLHPDLAASLDNLGVILSNEGEYDEADRTLTRALAIRRASSAQPHPLVGHTLNNLAVNEFNQGRYDSAETYYREALSVSRATYGPDHAYTAVDLANLGVLLDTKGDYAGADAMLTEALRITQAKLGDDHSETAFRMTQLGGMLRRKGDYDRAEALLRKSLAIEARVLEPDHRSHGVTLNHLAMTLQEKGDYAAAEHVIRSAVDVFRKSLGAEHPFTGTVTCSLGFVMHLQGRRAEGEAQMLDGLRILAASLPPGHDMIALNEGRYGELLLADGRLDEARPLLERSRAVLLETFGADHKDTRLAASRLAALEKALKQKK